MIGDVTLSSLQHSSGVNKGGANYGLTQSPNTVFSYNTVSGDVSTLKYKGQSGSSMNIDPSPTISDGTVFNMPSFITDKDNVQYFPLNYWFSSTNVQYFSPTPPTRLVDEAITGANNTYMKKQTVKNLTATDVRTYNTQNRVPDQSVVMQRAFGANNPVSARDHLFQALSISSEPRSWHWCHLIAHSLRHNDLGQVEVNLVAGTAAVNGAMLALENAVKEFLIQKDSPVAFLDYEVQALVISGTHIAKYIKATIGQWSQLGSKMWSYVHYMEATIGERDLTSMTKEHVERMVENYNKRI